MLTKRVSAVIETAQSERVECPECHTFVLKQDMIFTVSATGQRYACTACYVEKN